MSTNISEIEFTDCAILRLGVFGTATVIDLVGKVCEEHIMRDGSYKPLVEGREKKAWKVVGQAQTDCDEIFLHIVEMDWSEEDGKFVKVEGREPEHRYVRVEDDDFYPLVPADVSHYWYNTTECPEDQRTPARIFCNINITPRVAKIFDLDGVVRGHADRKLADCFVQYTLKKYEDNPVAKAFRDFWSEC